MELITLRERERARRQQDYTGMKKEEILSTSSWSADTCIGATFSCGLTGNSGATHVSCRSNCQSTGVWFHSLHDCARWAAQDYQGPTALKHLPLLLYQRDTIALPAKTPVNSHSFFFSKLHVPAAQCDTIRSWLCVNQTMTAWPRGCLACCHSLVANPLPRERGNWFPGPPVGMLLPSSCMAQ